MKQQYLQQYLFHRTPNKKQIQLQLSDSQNNSSQQKKSKPKEKQSIINDLFNSRKKTRFTDQIGFAANTINKQIDTGNNQFKSQPNNILNKPTRNKYMDPNKKPEQQGNTLELNITTIKKHQNLFKQKEQDEIPIYKFHNDSKCTMIQMLHLKVQQEKKINKLKRKQQKIQQQKRKEQQNKKRKTQTFKRFLSNIKNKDDDQLHNIGLFNKFQQQLLEKDQKVVPQNNNQKNNIGLVYAKITPQKQKIPISFLKLLLSFKFTPEFPTQQTKKVPNFFQDSMTYKKIFHYLVLNQCIADIHYRISSISQKSTPSISIIINNFKKNSDGFIHFSMNQSVKAIATQQQSQQKQKFMLKNLSLSRNRLGLITNSKHFKIQHYGVPCDKNDRIFSFLCLLITPQSKQQLNSQVKGLCNIQIDNLDLIMKANKTSRSYFYDLQKISTHIRQYLAVSHIQDTEVAEFVYNPLLIQKKHLQMIPQKQRQMLQPILNKLKAQYNNTQYQSIRQMALRQSGIVLLQGPPGTGKTTTLMGLLSAEYEYLKNISEGQKKKILICAPSNAAINHVTKRLVCEGLLAINQAQLHCADNADDQKIQCQNISQNSQRIFPKILRVGIVQTNDEDILSVSLDDICDKKMMQAKNSNIKRNNMTTTQIKQKMINISKEINKLRTRKDLQQWQIQSQISSLKYQIKKYQSLLFNFRKQRIQLKQTYNQIQSKLFEEADIILTTLSSSGSDKMQKLKGLIGCLIVDEAAQSTQPGILIPFQSGVRKILLIGDPYQLPATTISQDSSITLFNRSLFQRFLNNEVKPYFLNIQYRMAPMIRQFPSQAFYQNRLIDAESVTRRYLSSQNKHPQQLSNIQTNKIYKLSEYFNRNSIFIDVKFGRQQFISNSYLNIQQCFVVKKLLLTLIQKTQLTIGVITPYQSQKKYLLKQLLKQINSKNIFHLQQQQQNNQNYRNFKDSSDSQQNSCVLGQSISLQQGQYDKKNNKQKKIQYSQIQQQNSHHKKQKQQIAKNWYSSEQKKKKTLQELLQQRVMINTVDSFQGQQKDIIIVSTVRSNTKRDIGFMKDQRRINVALTRSRHLLIVIGHGDTIGSNETWNKYLEWSEHHKCYYQISKKQDIPQIFGKLSKGCNEDKITRIKYIKLSHDVRKQKRQQIKRQDFDLGINGKKKIKIHQPNHLSSQDEILNMELKQFYGSNQQLSNFDQQRNQQMLNQKRQREQQAKKVEEVNKKIKELEQKMMQDQENPYAKLLNFTSF